MVSFREDLLKEGTVNQEYCFREQQIHIILTFKYKYKTHCTNPLFSLCLPGCALWNSNEYYGIIFQLDIFNKYIL